MRGTNAFVNKISFMIQLYAAIDIFRKQLNNTDKLNEILTKLAHNTENWGYLVIASAISLDKILASVSDAVDLEYNDLDECLVNTKDYFNWVIQKDKEIKSVYMSRHNVSISSIPIYLRCLDILSLLEEDIDTDLRDELHTQIDICKLIPKEQMGLLNKRLQEMLLVKSYDEMLPTKEDIDLIIAGNTPIIDILTDAYMRSTDISLDSYYN